MDECGVCGKTFGAKQLTWDGKIPNHDGPNGEKNCAGGMTVPDRRVIPTEDTSIAGHWYTR